MEYFQRKQTATQRRAKQGGKTRGHAGDAERSHVFTSKLQFLGDPGTCGARHLYQRRFRPQTSSRGNTEQRRQNHGWIVFGLKPASLEPDIVDNQLNFAGITDKMDNKPRQQSRHRHQRNNRQAAKNRQRMRKMLQGDPVNPCDEPTRKAYKNPKKKKPAKQEGVEF